MTTHFSGNWAHGDNKKGRHDKAIKLAAERKKWEKGKTEVIVPDPNNPRAFIIKYV